MKVFLLMGVLVGGGWAMGAEKVNVLFLIADDLSAEALGCFGNGEVQTPNIDALAGRGMKWTRAYCQFPVCGPSRAALMSGLYPQQNGVTGNGSSEKLTKTLGKRPTLPEYFKQSGWHTARVSKIYHMRVPGDITAGVDGPDHAASWSEKHNCHAPEWMTEGEAENVGDVKVRMDGEAHYNLGFGSAFYVVRGKGEGAEQADHLAAARAVEILREKREERLFLAVGFVRPHVPLVAPEKFFAAHPAAKMTLPEAVEEDREDIPKAGRSRTFGIADKPAEKRKVLSAYMRYKDGSEELYDMEKDPRQFVNLAAREEGVIKELRARLAERLAAMK